MIDIDRRVSTAALAASDVPSPGGTLEMEREGHFPAIWVFAAAYRPPAALPGDLPAFVAEATLDRWTRTHELPEFGVDSYRLVLWWLFHHWRHTQSEGKYEERYATHTSLTRALVERIHLELYQEESWWWEPNHEPTDEERWQRALSRAAEGRDLAELYELAAGVLWQAIQKREAGEPDPMNLPLIEEDPLWAARVHTAYLLAHGLLASGDGSTLDEARDRAYERAASLGG